MHKIDAQSALLASFFVADASDMTLGSKNCILHHGKTL